MHIEATADVPDGATPQQAIDHLKHFVAAELAQVKAGGAHTERFESIVGKRLVEQKMIEREQRLRAFDRIADEMEDERF